jgi:hypothetical protein
VLHLLPCLTTFNLALSIIGSELNNGTWSFINMQLVALVAY